MIFKKSSQNTSNFYLLMAPRDENTRGGWQVKRVNSVTGPTEGTTMTDAIEEATSVTDQTEMLWKSDSLSNYLPNIIIIFIFVLPGGWRAGVPIRFHIRHCPSTGLIRVRLYESNTLIQDTGDIFDMSSKSLKGGRIGVWCNSQEKITWSFLINR